MVAEVLGREVRAGEDWLYLDVGAYNGLMETQQTVGQWRFPLWSSRADHAAVEQVPFTVTGPSCDSSDTMFFGALLPITMAEGDRVFVALRGRLHPQLRLALQRVPAASDALRGVRPVDSSAGRNVDGDRRRLHALMAAGLVDSFCLSMAWTVVVLEVTRRHGLLAAGACSTAMLLGVALSAPIATWMAHRLDGRRLLRVAGITEAALRISVFVLLAAGVVGVADRRMRRSDERRRVDGLRRNAGRGRRRHRRRWRDHVVRHDRGWGRGVGIAAGALVPTDATGRPADDGPGRCHRSSTWPLSSPPWWWREDRGSHARCGPHGAPARSGGRAR